MGFDFGYKTTAKYNGIKLKDIGIKLIDEDLEVENDLGIIQGINLNNNVLVDTEKEGYEFDIYFIREDANGNLYPIDTTYMKEVNRVFYDTADINGVNALDIMGYIYYVVPIGGTLTKTQMDSICSITFQSITPYKYGAIVSKTSVVTNATTNVAISNGGLSKCYANATIKCLVAGNITIKNTITNATITINNCTVNETFIIDGENVDIVGIDYGRVIGDVRNTFKLGNGSNTLSVTCTGSFNVVVEHQPYYGVW